MPGGSSSGRGDDGDGRTKIFSLVKIFTGQISLSRSRVPLTHSRTPSHTPPTLTLSSLFSHKYPTSHAFCTHTSSTSTMKFGAFASLCVAAFGTAAQAAPFDTLLSLVQQLQDEATALSTEYGAKDDEIAALMSQLTLCQGSDDDGAEEEEEEQEDPPTLAPKPEAPAPRPTPEPTPAVTPLPEESEEEEEEEEPSTPTSGDFSFSVGQSWNYNLASPYNVDLDVDVFFIDMGESLFGRLFAASVFV